MIQNPLQGTKYINDKEIQERVNQYNLKNRNDKRVDIAEGRLDKSPQGSVIPKVNNVNINSEEHVQDDEKEIIVEQ